MSMAREDAHKEAEELLYHLSVPRLEFPFSPYQFEFSFMVDEVRSREEKISLQASESSSNRKWYDTYQEKR